MTYCDLTFGKPCGLVSLNNHLEGRSYVELVEGPTQNDVAILKAIESSGLSVCPRAHPHVARWARNIRHFMEKKAQCVAAARASIEALVIETASAAEEAEPGKANTEDDIDLFGSDEEEDAEAEALKARRLAEYQAKKANKPKVIAKSSVIVDVKPWEDTTDMKEMEQRVRAITMDGLIWGTSKLVPIGYGIRKLQISCAIEDEKVSMDTIEEQIIAIEDLVQSMDIVSFNKI